MIQQQGNALTFYAHYIASKVSKTGLTVTVDIYEVTTGTPIVSGGSVTELGGGLYYYTLPSGSVDANGAYIAVFKTSDTSVDQQHLPAIWQVGTTWVANLDAAVTSRLAPTTAGRTLDVSAGGEAGVDWANVGSPTTMLNLSGTTVKTATDVETDTANIQSRLPAALSGDGYMFSEVRSIRGDGDAAVRAMYYFTGAILEGSVSEAGQTTTFETSLGLGGYEDNTFENQVICFLSGDNVGSKWRITASDGTTGDLTIDGSLPQPTQIGDQFLILPLYQSVNVEAVNESGAAATSLAANIGNLDAAISSRSTLTAAQVWDALTSGMVAAGSIGKAIVDFLTGGGGGATAAQVWDYLTSAANTVGSMGELVVQKLALIIGGSITIQSPLSANGQAMTIVQGDDYYAADGRSFDWSSDDWPNLTGATVVWTATRPAVPSDTHTAAVTVVTPGVGTQTVRLELPRATTSDMNATSENSKYLFDVQATLSGSGRVVTLVPPTSTVTVLADITDS